MVFVMLTTTVLLTAGIAGSVVSLARLCRDLMIGRLIRKLLVDANSEQLQPKPGAEPVAKQPSKTNKKRGPGY